MLFLFILIMIVVDSSFKVSFHMNLNFVKDLEDKRVFLDFL